MTPLLLSGLTGRLTAEFETLRAWADAASEDHMSVMGMFMAADVIVKGVMLSLAFASVLVWAIFAARVALLLLGAQRLKSNYRALEAAGALGAAETRFAKGRGVVGAMVRGAIREHGASFEGGPSGVKTRTDSALSRIEAGAARNMQRGSGVLAIVGSSAPFVGLFGTVWGIMNSFISIAETNTTNLAVVAPGIAEALLATAIGLVAAIPAVIFYNLLAKMNGGYRSMLADASALVSRTLSRDLDLGRDVTAPAPAEAPAPAPAAPVASPPKEAPSKDAKRETEATPHHAGTLAPQAVKTIEPDADTGLKTPLPAE